MSSFGRSIPNADEVQQALMLLHEHPHCYDDALEPTAAQEKACDVIFDAVLPRLLQVCRKYHLPVDEAPDVAYPVIRKFLMRHVALVPPVIERAFGWMDRACVNEIRSRHRQSTRASRMQERYATDESAAWIGGTPATSDSAASLPDESRWLDVPLPPGVTTEHWMQALAQLRPSDQAFLKLAQDLLDVERSESPDPRAFDQQPYRLPAKKIAQLLGRTANSVSVQWARIHERLRMTCIQLLAQQLQSEGQSIPTIRTHLKPLASEAEIDALLVQLKMSEGPIGGDT